MIFAILLLHSLILPPAEARLIDRTAALVNGDVILQSDIQSFRKTFGRRREIDQFIALTGFAPDKDAEILEYLVQENMVLQKFPATEEEVEDEINAVQKNNKIDRDKLKEALSQMGVNFDEYRRLMRISVSKRKLVERELRPVSVVTDDEVRNYYYTSIAYREKRKDQRLVLSYTLKQMTLPTLELAESTYKRLKGGADFDAIASELSAQGVKVTELGKISEDAMNDKIKVAVQNLKVGETTKPLGSDLGFLLLKITDLGAPKDPVFEKEADRIKGELFQKTLLTQLKLWTERERAASYVSISLK